MSDNSPLKIRTMADDLEKAEKREMGAVAPSVSGASASLKNKETPSPRTSGHPVFKEKERKSLKDVLIQLGEGEKSSELPKKEIISEEINPARDWKKEGEEILKIEKELEKPPLTPPSQGGERTAEKEPPLTPPSQGGEETVEKKPPLTPSPEHSGQGGERTVEKELKPKSSIDALKKIEETAEKTKEVSETPYLSPSARLLYNKPEDYSSVLNKVKEKREKAEVSGIKDVFKHQEPRKEEKKETPEQEYKKFKKSFKGVYQAGLAEKTSKRLILTLAIAIAIGIISVLAWSLIIKKPPEEQLSEEQLKEQPLQPAPKAAVEEIKEFSLIESEILIELEKDGDGLISKINAQSARMEKEKGLPDISRVTVKKEGAIIPLEELLVELEIEMPRDTLDLFDNNRYNLLLFKEEFGVKRLGLALATDNPSAARLKFRNWENENIAGRKIYRVFEPLFLGSRIASPSQEKFKTEEYLGVEMRYIQIPDKNTSLDYLFYGDILVITTSKSSAFRVVEVLISP